MSNMRKTAKKVLMIVPELEDVARLKRYATDRGLYNTRGEPNCAGAVCEIIAIELRRRYPELTAAEYQWCAAEQAANEARRESGAAAVKEISKKKGRK